MMLLLTNLLNFIKYLILSRFISFEHEIRVLLILFIEPVIPFFQTIDGNN